jgi:hypothetical protein
VQQYPLLKTKLYVPAIRTKLVSRPRLIERRSTGLPPRLTFISTPFIIPFSLQLTPRITLSGVDTNTTYRL